MFGSQRFLTIYVFGMHPKYKQHSVNVGCVHHLWMMKEQLATTLAACLQRFTTPQLSHVLSACVYSLPGRCWCQYYCCASSYQLKWQSARVCLPPGEIIKQHSQQSGLFSVPAVQCQRHVSAFRQLLLERPPAGCQGLPDFVREGSKQPGLKEVIQSLCVGHLKTTDLQAQMNHVAARCRLSISSKEIW